MKFQSNRGAMLGAIAGSIVGAFVLGALGPTEVRAADGWLLLPAALLGAACGAYRLFD